MTARHEPMPPLPENCAVRLIDLDPAVNGLIAVSEDGFVNIYINARLSRDAQLRALRHELNHYYRNDLYSDEDIRKVERLADEPLPAKADSAPAILDITGAPVERSLAFDPSALRPLGRGIYQPLGDNLRRIGFDLKRLREALLTACGIYDVMRGEPAPAMARLADALSERDIAFIAWQRRDTCFDIGLRFYREAKGRLHGALYYNANGLLDNALAVFETGEDRITVDICARGEILRVCGISRGAMRVY